MSTCPGCAHDKWLDAHHVMHWVDVDGGETSLANTLLLCSTHHRLLHEGGYTIHKNFAGDWYFRNGNGKVIPGEPVNDCVREPQASFAVGIFLVMAALGKDEARVNHDEDT